MPSEFRDLYDRVSYQDIKMKVRLRSEELMANTMSQYESFCLVANAALGGKPSRGADPATAPQTADDLEAALQRSMG